jgi:hypothetical protein
MAVSGLRENGAVLRIPPGAPDLLIAFSFREHIVQRKR